MLDAGGLLTPLCVIGEWPCIKVFQYDLVATYTGSNSKNGF